MPRKYKPVELPLKPVTELNLTGVEARCPRCDAVDTTILGRLGLRFVFRCQSCTVRFFRVTQSPHGARI